jgi:hypothetical protein
MVVLVFHLIGCGSHCVRRQVSRVHHTRPQAITVCPVLIMSMLLHTLLPVWAAALALETVALEVP